MSKVTFDLDVPRVMNKFKISYNSAQQWLDNQVLVDCEPYLPMNTGNLRNSGIRGTHIGSGQVIYNAPYARETYYNYRQLKFRTDKHPKAQQQWFEAAKGVHQEKWIEGAKRAFKRSGE